MKFPMLFSPIKTGKLELPNRIVSSPCGTGTPTPEGFVSDRMVDLYAEYGRGGAALIVVEDAFVEPRGKRRQNDLNFYDDSCMEGMRRIAETIHRGGAKAALHLSHGGNYGDAPLWTGSRVRVGVSQVPFPGPGFMVPRELTIDEILEIEDKYAEAALRAKQVGFDVVALHGAHMYLINQFLSRASNRRQDAYGGSFGRRIRFLLEMIGKIKQKIGNDFPIMVSLNGEEVAEGGLTIEDARQNARRLEAAGVNFIRISVKNPDESTLASYDYIPLRAASPMRFPHGYLVHLAAAVKDAVSIPIMTQGRIITPQDAEQYLEQGRVDLIGIGRGLFADPEWPRKAQEGRENEIRHCISCEWCSNITKDMKVLSCVVNPRYAREAESVITPAAKAKTVFVAGGGPAGLEAARVAALRGHKVTLYEKSMIGGQVNLASVPPGKSDVKLFINFQKVQMDLLGVKIKHEELTADAVKREKPDAVVVATGALPAHPDFPGSRRKNVATYWQVLDGSFVPKGKVVVLGGRMIGGETAEYLASRGHQVTIVEESNAIARDALMEQVGENLKISLRLLGVKVLTNTVFEEITESGVTISQKGQRSSVDADTVVLALGTKPNRELADQLKDLDIEIHVIGDCAGVGKMLKAIRGGFQAGCAL